MKIILLTVGKTADRLILPLIDRYIDRLAHIAPFEYKVLSDVRVPQNAGTEKQKELEGAQFLQTVRPGDVVILLDERGKTETSRQFATRLDKLMANTRGNIIFIIGGPYGFSKEIYDRANGMLSLSVMTMTHEMARYFFTEQLYRAFAILRGLPYHHD